jgi:hypothetical protein
MFKVYNGPMEVVRFGVCKVRLPPKCAVVDCQCRIGIEVSDRWCFSHALEYVIRWDKQNKAEIKDDEQR